MPPTAPPPTIITLPVALVCGPRVYHLGHVSGATPAELCESMAALAEAFAAQIRAVAP